MAGRTVAKYIRFVVGDTGAVLREVPIFSLAACGIVFNMVDLTAFQDAVKGALPGVPDAPIDITGPVDTSAAVAVAASGAPPALSGSHTVLSPLAGATTPLSLGVYFGIQHYWTTATDPTFGISKTATSGYLLYEYTISGKDPLTYSAKFRLYPGSALPAWAFTVVT